MTKANAEKKKEIDTRPTNIHEALLMVYEQVGYVEKTGKMDYGSKYSYASESDLIHALRPAIVKAGVLVYPLNIETLDQSDGKGKVKYTFRFQHAHSDTYIDVPAIGEGVDKGDKASYKAATGAMKYALRQTFVMETGDDPDETSSEEIAKYRQPLTPKPPKPPEPTEEQWVEGTNTIVTKILGCDSVTVTAHELRHSINKARSERPDLFKLINDALTEKMESEALENETVGDSDELNTIA